MARSKDLEIRDVRIEESSRGTRGKTDVRTARERQRFRGEIARLFSARNETGFIGALQRAGIPEPHFSKALRLWRELQEVRSQTGEMP